MPKGSASEADNYPVPEDVLLNAQCGLVVVRETEFEYKAHHKAVQSGRARVGEKGKIVRWRWPFNLVDEDYKGLTVEGETDPRITTAEGDRARQWYETILNTEIKEGDDFDTDLLNGLPCVITVVHGEPRPRRDGGLFYPLEIGDVFPAGSNEQVPF